MSKQKIDQNWQQNADRVSNQTSDAISQFLRSQEGKGTTSDVAGMASGFLKQAAVAISIIGGGDEKDAERLYRKFVDVIEKFFDEL